MWRQNPGKQKGCIRYALYVILYMICLQLLKIRKKYRWVDINRLLVNSQAAPRLYALVYSMWTPEEWRFVAISILVSLGSMAFAFAGIDLKDGLNGIPGLLKHWLNPATLKKKNRVWVVGAQWFGILLGMSNDVLKSWSYPFKRGIPKCSRNLWVTTSCKLRFLFNVFWAWLFYQGLTPQGFSALISGIFSDPQ